MNKKELKQLIKPLVKECINEVLLQEGVLSSIISEVMVGTQSAIVREAQAAPPRKPDRKLESDDEAAKRLQERKRQASSQKRKLLDAIGTNSYNGVNLFEGTEPLNQGGTPSQGESPQGALSGYAPEDSGVDISGLMNLAGGSWKKI